jgi:GST-like protein
MIELWSVPTANGQKVHIALEEAGLADRAFVCGEAFSV